MISSSFHQNEYSAFSPVVGIPEVKEDSQALKQKLQPSRGSLPFKKRKFDIDIDFDVTDIQQSFSKDNKGGVATNPKSVAEPFPSVAGTAKEDTISPKLKENKTRKRAQKRVEYPTIVKTKTRLSYAASNWKIDAAAVPFCKPIKDNSKDAPASRPPLAAAAAGRIGCHGRTTRTDSYCQRIACYNGSNYCKLHYQQYVVYGIRSDHPSSSSLPSLSASPDSPVQVSTMDLSADCLSSSVRDSPSSPKTPSKKLKYQNKCFNTTSRTDAVPSKVSSDAITSNCNNSTGHRCQATTTRGLPCAYVAVANVKYCFLHAEYDTNPPRRRRPRQDALKSNNKNHHPLQQHLPTALVPPSSTTMISQGSNYSPTSETSLIQQWLLMMERNSISNVLQDPSPLTTLLPLQYGTDGASSSFIPPQPPPQVDDYSNRTLHSLLRSLMKDNNNNNATTTTVTMSDHPQDFMKGSLDESQSFLYLSQLPKNQWQGQFVLILSGPFQYQIGNVKKWGNGWVTVLIPNHTGALDGILGKLLENHQGSLFVQDDLGRCVFHNRRAFELCLVAPVLTPMLKRMMAVGVVPTTTTTTGTTMTVTSNNGSGSHKAAPLSLVTGDQHRLIDQKVSSPIFWRNPAPQA